MDDRGRADVVAAIVAAIRSPRIDGEKTLTLTVRDRRRGKMFVIRYEETVVIQQNGICRAYEPEDVEGVLKIELRDVVEVRKSRYVSCGDRRPVDDDMRDLRTHFQKFDADSEDFRVAQMTFATRRGLTADLIIVAHDGASTVVERRSEIVITRDDRPTVTRSEFGDLDTALRCVRDHLAFRDDRAIAELGHETKAIELFSGVRE